METQDLSTPNWLQEPWLNYTKICAMLYDSDDRRYTGLFAQKRNGTRPWKPEELDKLERIRENLQGKLKKS